MTETKQKILSIIEAWANSAVSNKRSGASVYDPYNAEELSDALIEAGIGDVERIQSENAALRERLEKYVELPRIIHPNKNEWFIQYQLKSGIIDYSILYSKEAAEACLAELKGDSGGKNADKT